MVDPVSELSDGIRILKPIFELNGFALAEQKSGQSSGGRFASAAFVRGDRKFEFHVRGSLGLICYHIGTCSLENEAYMRLLGVYGRNHYPSFDSQIRQQFEALARDLREFCQDFLAGSGQEFCKIALEFSKNPKQFRGLPA